MDSFGNLVIIALGSKDFTRLMCDFMEPCHNPMLRVPLKKNIGRMLRQVPTSKELSSYPVPPALGEKWIVTGESTLLDNIIGLYFFPTTLPKSTGWVPSFLAGQNTNYSRKKKKQQKQQPTLENNFQSGECSQQPPTNLLSRQRMWVWWFQGHFLSPQHFSSLNFNRWENAWVKRWGSWCPRKGPWQKSQVCPWWDTG